MSAGEVDTRVFTAICETIASFSGREFAEVVLPMTARLLTLCVKKTHSRTVPDITRRVSEHAGFIEFADGTVITTWKSPTAGGDAPTMYLDASTYPQYAKRWPKKSRIPSAGGGGFAWHQMNGPFHWSDQRWAAFQAKQAQIPEIRRRRLEEALDARGLAQKSWYQIAQSLGLNLAVDEYVRQARHKKAPPREGFSESILTEAGFIVEMMNANPLVVGKLHGRQIVNRAIAQMDRAFDKHMRKGVFDKIKRRAKLYPGVFLK